MKIIALKNNLKEALVIAERGVGENANLPILKNVLLRAENNTLILSSTNLEIGITVRASVKVMEPGTAAVSASVFGALISNIQNERLNIEAQGGHLEIRSDNSEITLPLAQVDDFPIIPAIENDAEYLEISASVLREALERVLLAVQFSDIRPDISGVLFNLEPDGLIIAGTDIFRLAEKRLAKSLYQTTYERGLQCIVPLKTVQEVLRLLKDDEGVRCYFEESQVLFRSKNAEIVSRLVNANFPDYRGMKIIPTEFKTEVEFEREELMNALKLSSSVGQSATDVKMQISDNGKSFEILSTEKSFGKMKSTIPARVTGDAMTVLFNWRYLYDGLKGFTDKKVTLWLTGSDKAAMLKSGDQSYLYLLMPARQ
jgi:DNA polymerase-3 subunit beta